jgi:hypothetical protein
MVLDPDEAHAWPAHGLADRVSILLVVLVAPYVGLHVLRRQQLRLVPQCHQLARPVVRPAAGFQTDLGRRQLREKLQEVAPAQLLAQHRLFRSIHAM